MKLFLTGLLFCFALYTKAQTNNQILLTDTACNKGKVYERVEQMPTFKQGNDNLIKTLNANLHFDDSLKGKFVVVSKINCEGKIFEIEVEKGINTTINKQLLNAILKSGDWLPGKQNGYPIDCINILFLKVVNGKISM